MGPGGRLLYSIAVPQRSREDVPRSRRRLLIGALLAAALVAGPAEARVYQWHNPGTGSVELSGTPHSTLNVVSAASTAARSATH